jgi:hypothetical protein
MWADENYIKEFRTTLCFSNNLQQIIYLYFTCMKETFQIPVTYRVKELQFDAQLLQLRYIRKIHVDVNTIIFYLKR